jgi:hypothetical protein
MLPVTLLLIVALGIGIALVVGRVPTILSASGCQVGKGSAALALDPEQAAIAATIAGVAAHRGLPARAVTVAYAAGLQESHLHNLDYGDRDSVGVFQQRPSEGWGPRSKLKDPVYATTRFFQALVKVPRYRRIPVYRAAQAVQHSADGFAYVQYQQIAAQLAASFSGSSPHNVWCWSAGTQTTSHQQEQLAAARKALAKTFGPLPADEVSSPRDDPAILVRPPGTDTGWAVATWLVTHAARFSLRSVRYAGYQWRASAGESGWIRAPGGQPGAVQAS